MSAERELRNRIASHNRHAIVAAVICLFGSWFAWLIAYGLVIGLTLGFLTSIHGDEVVEGRRLLSIPGWVHPAFLALAAGLLIWGSIDQRARRFRPVDDRPIVGWHIFGDIVLAPARLTFGIWNHLGAVVRLDSRGIEEALGLLRQIRSDKKCSRSSLGAYIADARDLPRLLEALQFAGLIDFLQQDDVWYYFIPASEEESVNRMAGAEVTKS